MRQLRGYRLHKSRSHSRRWLLATLPRPIALFWLFQYTNIFKFNVSFGVSIRLKLDYIRLHSVRLKVLLTRLTSGDAFTCICTWMGSKYPPPSFSANVAPSGELKASLDAVMHDGDCRSERRKQHRSYLSVDRI